MSDAAKVLGDALTLPAAEKAAVIVQLLASLDGEADVGVDEAWAAEIQRRVEDIREGSVNSSPLDSVLEELDKVVET